MLDVSGAYCLIVGQCNIMNKMVLNACIGNLRVEELMDIVQRGIYSGQNCALKVVDL